MAAHPDHDNICYQADDEDDHHPFNGLRESFMVVNPSPPISDPPSPVDVDRDIQVGAGGCAVLQTDGLSGTRSGGDGLQRPQYPRDVVSVVRSSVSSSSSSSPSDCSVAIKSSSSNTTDSSGSSRKLSGISIATGNSSSDSASQGTSSHAAPPSGEPLFPPGMFASPGPAHYSSSGPWNTGRTFPPYHGDDHSAGPDQNNAHQSGRHPSMQMPRTDNGTRADEDFGRPPVANPPGSVIWNPLFDEPHTYPWWPPQDLEDDRNPWQPRIDGGKFSAKKCLKRCGIPVFIIGVLAVVACAWTLSVLGDDPSFHAFLARATLQMTIDEPFHADLSDLSSPYAAEYTARVCGQMKGSLKNHSEVKEVQNCIVDHYSELVSGLGCRMDMEVFTKSNLSQADFKRVLIESGQEGENSSFLRYGDLSTYHDSMRVTTYSVIEVVSELPTTPPTTVPAPDAEFDCSVTGELFKPYNDTYPSRCNRYQHCVNGQSHELFCHGDHEFAYEPKHVLCQSPSNSTYCGRKRAQNSVTSSTADVTSSTTVVMQTSSTTLNVTSSTTVVTQTSPTTLASTVTTDLCASLDPLILQNSSALYSCNATAAQSFHASETTFPHNCGIFVWCVDGVFRSVEQCGPDTSFVFGIDDPVLSCDKTGTPRTFCSQMKLAADCR